MNYMIFCVCVLSSVLCSGSYVEIPENTCPYFSYMNSEYNYVFGRLVLPNDGQWQYDLRLSASIRGVYQSLPNLDIRLITTVGEIFSAANIEYWIYFPFWNNIPKITMVMLNGNTYCTGTPFPVDYGIGTTTMWAQYIYSIGTENNVLIPTQYPLMAPLSNQYPLEASSSLEYPQTVLSLETPPQVPKDNLQNLYLFTQPQYIPDKSVPSQNSQDLSTFMSPQYPLQQSSTTESPIALSASSEEESGPLESPSQTFQHSATTSAPPVQNVRQKPVQSITDYDANLTYFQQNCGMQNEQGVSFRIFNGNPTIEGQYPWLAALLLSDGSPRGLYKCVANLISPKHLLTAAHCVIHFAKEKLLLQFYSSETTDNQPVFEYLRSITDVQISPFYITEPFGDVALLTMNQSVISLNRGIKPICLWSGGKELDYTGTVAGWGLDENELYGIGTAKAIDISMVSHSKCIETYGLESDYRLFNDYCFCTAHINAMPCRGDSGAGFMVNSDGRYFLRGIVSVGYRFCGRSSYTIFVDIVPHLNWILRVLG